MGSIQPYILGIEGLALTEKERALFRERPPFGIILFLRNIDNPDQLRALVEDIKTITGEQTLLFIDQEGGRVQRLAPPYWSKFPIAANFDDIQDLNALDQKIYALYRLISDELVQAGMDVNCAPCLDLRTDITATFLQDRTFGHHLERIVTAGHASVRAMNDAGIAPVIKHLPGHGRANVDSHLHLPKVIFDANPYEVIPDDVKIFQEDYGVDMAMNAHILYPQIDPNFPLTLSPKGIDFIRNIVGFKGLVMSDDLAMKALSGTQGELARRAFDAGLDVALSCSGKIKEIEDIYTLNFEANELVKQTHAKLLKLTQSRPAILEKHERAELQRQMQLEVKPA